MRSRSRTTRTETRSQLLLSRRQLPSIQSTVKELQCGNGLVKANLVTRLIHTSKGEVSVFASLAVFHTVNEERRITGSLELFAVLVLGCEGDSLATEPVADVVGVTVDQGNTYGAGEDIF